MYSIAAAADLTGLCQETIREWELSYDLVTPRPTESGQLRYRDDDLRALTTMASLVDVGWRPEAAAHEAKARAVRAVARARPARLARLAGVPPDDLTTTYVAAARRLDAPTLSEVLDAAWECNGPTNVVDDWLLPAVRHLGSARDRAEVGAAGAHLAVDMARGRLMAEYADALCGVGPGGPQVLVGLAAGLGHDLGVLAFAGLLARSGVATSFLGGQVPDGEWELAARASKAAHVVLAVHRPQDVVPTARLAERVLAARPGIVVHVGGRHQHLVTPPLRTLGHHVATAVDALALTLACERLAT